jgi:hypothetical protein
MFTNNKAIDRIPSRRISSEGVDAKINKQLVID